MTRRVIIPPKVLRDLARTARSIADNVSDSSARKWRMRVEAALQKLATNAEQWPEADECDTLGGSLRCRLVGRRRHVYRILFRFDHSTVEIVKVRHSAQDYLTEDDL